MSKTGNVNRRCRDCWTCYLVSRERDSPIMLSSSRVSTSISMDGMWTASSYSRRPQVSLASFEGSPTFVHCCLYVISVFALFIPSSFGHRTVVFFSPTIDTSKGAHLIRCHSSWSRFALCHSIVFGASCVSMLSPFCCYRTFSSSGLTKVVVALDSERLGHRDRCLRCLW